MFPGRQVGVAGRTGCGKSTLFLTLFRIGGWQHSLDLGQRAGAPVGPLACVFAVLYPWPAHQHSAWGPLSRPAVEPCGGSIAIDGIDICSIGLRDLRSRLALVPQASISILP